MRDRPSRTAQQVAMLRALESGLPDGRLFEDPLATHLLDRRYRMVVRLAGLPGMAAAIPRVVDRVTPTHPYASAVVRTRLIDDLVLDAVAGGARQVLLLGAGFDGRAFRLPRLGALPVFEVDHPATQRVKLCRLRRAVDPEALARVRFVPVDFERDDLDKALRSAGFTAEPTVVVWEGVTTYLSAEAVDGTVRWAARLPAGSTLVFTYVERRVLTDRKRRLAIAVQGRAIGEPWTFGFDPAELPTYLAERGLRLTVDLSSRQLADRYLAPLGRHGPASGLSHVASALVEPVDAAGGG